MRDLIWERNKSDGLLGNADRKSVRQYLLRAHCTLDHFPSRRVAERILSIVWATKEHGQYSQKPSGVRTSSWSLPPLAYPTKQCLVQLAGNFLTKPISEASLLHKDAESAAASPEHKRPHNQQRVHRHIPRSKEQGAKNGFAARLAPYSLLHGSVSELILTCLLWGVCD